MIKKIILLIIVVLIISIGFVFVFNKSKNSEEIGFVEKILNTPENKNEAQPSSSEIKGTTEEYRKKFDSKETIGIETTYGDIVVKNFYKTALFITKSGNADITITNDYTITYIANEKRFHITITSEDIGGAIKTAESAILQILNIKKLDACKLNITMFVEGVFDLDGKYNKIFYLSFCPPK